VRWSVGLSSIGSDKAATTAAAAAAAEKAAVLGEA